MAFLGFLVCRAGVYRRYRHTKEPNGLYPGNHRGEERSIREFTPRMSCARMPTISCRSLSVFFAGVASLALLSGPGLAADAKRAVSLTVLPSAKSMASAPSGAELVGKLLAEQNGPCDPDVPLPQPHLMLR